MFSDMSPLFKIYGDEVAKPHDEQDMISATATVMDAYGISAPPFSGTSDQDKMAYVIDNVYPIFAQNKENVFSLDEFRLLYSSVKENYGKKDISM